MALALDAGELQELMAREFPQVAPDFIVESADEDGVTIRLKVTDRHLRPGNTVSGPTMFSMVDVGVYLAVLSRIGPQVLAVTTNCSLDFMRKPAPDRDLVARAELLKLGRRLAVGDVRIRSDGSDDVLARATLTYAIPPEQ